MAVRTFNGNYDDKVAELHKATLISLLQANKIKGKGTWEVYRYDPPWTPPAQKTNEVAIEVDMNQ